MDTVKVKFTVLFEEPFWIGVYERESSGWLEACKVMFGTEPKDSEVFDYLLNHWKNLSFGKPILSNRGKLAAKNPKRLQREAKKQVHNAGIGTKAQQAISLQREEKKQQRKIQSRLDKEEEVKRQFLLHQEKRKQKHKGH